MSLPNEHRFVDSEIEYWRPFGTLALENLDLERSLWMLHDKGSQRRSLCASVNYRLVSSEPM